MRINVMLKESVYPELTAHFENIPRNDRAERLRVLATYGLMALSESPTRPQAVTGAMDIHADQKPASVEKKINEQETKKQNEPANKVNEDLDDNDGLLGIGSLLL